MGFSVIPQKQNKQPYISWEKYQHELPSTNEINNWFSEWPNAMIGIITGAISGITVIDIDGKQGLDTMEDLLPDDFRCPAVRSPRGGRHLYFQYNEKLVTRSRDLPDIDTKSDGGLITAPPSVNADGKIYEWVDCFHIMRTPLPKVPQKYIEAVSSFREQRYPNLDIGDVNIEFSQGHRDETLFHVAYSLIKGGMQPENVEKVLINLSAVCNPPFPKNEALIKVRSAVERAFKKDRNLPQEIKDWVSVTTGVFGVTDIYNALHLVTPEEKNYARQILRRLKESHMVEAYGTRADVYRRVSADCVVMDFRNAQVEPLRVDWPLMIGDYFNTYSKNICVLAGAFDAGKTAFLLDFIKRNMHKWEVHYFNSEMSPEELRMRLDKHEDLVLDDWNFTAYERTDHYNDVIKPDAINIIDYIENNDNFYRIGDRIKEIHEKLGKGIAIIALQKEHGALFGRGGEFTAQRARLYVSIDKGVARIVKAKNRKDPAVNPVGLELKYKLVNGWKLIPVDGWYEPEEERGHWFKEWGVKK